MKGKILGFDEATGSGAISAEDGTRHKFARSEWRGGEKAPTAGMTVDFESEDGAARDVYPVAGSAMAALGTIGADLGALTESEQGARIAALMTRTLAAPLALLLLLACFLPALSTPVQSATLIGLGNAMDDLGRVAAAQAMLGGGKSGFDTIQTLLFLRFAAPLAALWLIWTAWSGKAERLPMLATGAAAIGAGLLVIMLRSAILSMVPDFVRDRMADGIGLGIGTWLLFLLGAALVAAGLGRLRNPLAKD
ncbi:hypothetical protein GCM10009115_02750 [Sphingopyxis soli]|uniref:Uncharacterized protein n=1 Tax=Sphingopyxis soli TaxID=592051 RepID=A0ABN1LWF7_9SPHN|nr:hypothetical protein [Sphingopyxis soli]